MIRTVIAVVTIMTSTIWLGTLAVQPAVGESVKGRPTTKPHPNHPNGAMKRVLFGAGGNKAQKGVKAR